MEVFFLLVLLLWFAGFLLPFAAMRVAAGWQPERRFRQAILTAALVAAAALPAVAVGPDSLQAPSEYLVLVMVLAPFNLSIGAWCGLGAATLAAGPEPARGWARWTAALALGSVLAAALSTGTQAEPPCFDLGLLSLAGSVSLAAAASSALLARCTCRHLRARERVRF